MAYRYLAIHPTADAFLSCKYPNWAVDEIKVKYIFSVKKSEIAHFL